MKKLNLAEKLNLNMEIAYVPVAKLKLVQEMMFNWKANNRKIRICSFVAAATSFVNAANFIYEENGLACGVSFLMVAFFVLIGLLVNKSSRIVYCMVFLPLVAFTLLPAYYPDATIRSFFMVTVFIPALTGTLFSYKALYNYKRVYIPLSKRKGFPNFVFSTADMYAERIYLKDKDEKTVAEKRVEAAYNPFNDQKDVTDEEVARMNSLHYREIVKDEQDVVGKEYYKSKELKYNAEEKYNFKKGFKIGDINIIIPHNEMSESTKAQNRIVMGQWNKMRDRLFADELVWIMVFASSIMIRMWTEPSPECFFLYGFLALYIFGNNLMKMGYVIGFPVMLGVYGFMALPASFFTVIVVILFTIIKIPGYLRWLINYPIYKKLSKQEGFPSFVETNADKYAKDIYIVEEQKPFKKGPKIDPIIMNIGYDDEDEDEGKRIIDFDYKEKNKDIAEKEDTAWNAFNYLANDAENSAYDEFAIYEEVNRRRREAAVEEAGVTPNKNMGRKNTNEN